MKKMKKWIFIFLIFNFISLVSCTSSKPDTRFNEAYNLVKKEYVKPISDQTLIDNAIKGMVQGLDPHSTYLNKNEWESFEALTRGEYAGIGIEVIPQKKFLKVMAVLDKGPAQTAGVLTGDHIIEANHESFDQMTFLEMIQRLKGPAGSPVDITIIRPHINKPLYFHLIRQKLDLKNITAKLYPQGIGYIRLAFFEENAAKEIQKNIESLQNKNHSPLNGLIIDVRNNPGGLLESATNVADLFLDYRAMGANHLIVYSKNRHGIVTYFAQANDKDILNHCPIIILINKGSASGAEVLAAALHDHHRATLVGTRTFGKGSVQSVIPLQNNEGAIKLTTGVYYTPHGKLIDKIGIPPDIEVIQKPSDKTDTALEKALKMLQ